MPLPTMHNNEPFGRINKTISHSQMLFLFLFIILAFLPCQSQLFPEGSSHYSPSQRPHQQHQLFRHAHPDQPTKPSNPVLIIPGDAGSRLRANLTGKPSTVHIFCDKYTKEYFDLWLNLEGVFAVLSFLFCQLFSPLIIDCWADNMRLTFNMSSGMAEDLAGVHVRVPGFGHTHTIEWLDTSKRSPSEYFSLIVETLVSWGYRRGINVASAPYDWRRAPRELSRYFEKLRNLVELLYAKNGNQRVIVLAHSMGNPIANYFYHNIVNQEWKDKFLAGHISLAGAWGGSAQVVKLFASGYNMDYWRVILPPSRLRQMQRSFTSSAFLFPSPKLWALNETLVSTPSKNYSMANLDEFFDDIDYRVGLAQLQSESNALVLEPPGLNVHCIYGTEIQTPEQFIWYHNWLFPNYQPYIRYGNGDGTVNQRSLTVCQGWDREQNGGHTVDVTELNGADHMGILHDARTIQLLQKILYEGNG